MGSGTRTCTIQVMSSQPGLVRSRLPNAGAGPLLREWRMRRRMSQLDLASVAEVSTRHLSYVETGRSTPSRELVLHLASHLDVPLREQNDLLLASGHAPVHSHLTLTDPEMASIFTTIETMLAAADPHPAFVMDRHWNLIMANHSAIALTDGVAGHILGPPLNLIRFTLHPEGLARRIVDLEATAAHLVHRLQRQHAITGDSVIGDLLTEAKTYVPSALSVDTNSYGPVLRLSLRNAGSTTNYLSVLSTIGGALDVTASELSIETFYIVN